MINSQKSSKIGWYVILVLLIPFWYLCWQVFHQDYFDFDSDIVAKIQSKRHFLLNTLSVIFYQLGDAHIAGFIVAIALAILVYKRYWQEAKAFAFATLGILLLVDQILKPFFNRRRPPKPRLVDDLSRDSFPSGHAAGNLVLYFYLSFILAVQYPKLAKYIYALATIIVLLVGWGSIYTNAHWATDVVAGYVFGYLWLLVSFAILRFFNRQAKNTKT